ncbi:MAG TPA: right-handed parallel beta-helix repeat-containing protein [Chitinophaga sp.]|uniref:right-handed parallel beta-helix repeat-containing protein n=1 Tax=Chitinophaga sp. TaxID=1869181 RepID=UPI002DB611F5|nr:right-handed parallel beta-helix repeat-containing protein [Chitinophaga sp.]HEU4552519.1 right-handed parallel beta-helix repeat-containing protein [Chitinophaga sp.]
MTPMVHSTNFMQQAALLRSKFRYILWALSFILTVTNARAQIFLFRTYVVNTPGDAGDPNAGKIGNDGRCDVNLRVPGDQCTFRAALENVNLNGYVTHVTIKFAIPDVGGTGNIVIPVGSTGLGPLPPILYPVSIDGLNDLGPGNRRLIELDGSKAGAGAVGFDIRTESDIQNFVITRFSSHGVMPASDVDIFVGNSYIGTDQQGTSGKGNGGDGLFTYKGAASIANCVIAGNRGYAVNVVGDTVPNTGFYPGAFLSNNLIGLASIGGKFLPNQAGTVMIQNGGGVLRNNTIVGIKNAVVVIGALSEISATDNIIGLENVGPGFNYGLLIQNGKIGDIEGNALANIGSVGIDMVIRSRGTYNVNRNKVTGKMKTGIRFRFPAGLPTVQVNFRNNRCTGNDIGLQIIESRNSIISWNIASDTAMNCQTGADIMFGSRGDKRLDSNYWAGNAGIGFKYRSDFAAPVTINGDAYVNNGAEGFSGELGARARQMLTFDVLKIIARENGKDGFNLKLSAPSDARAIVYFGNGSDLSMNQGAGLRLLGEKRSLQVFKVAIENLNIYGNRDTGAAVYLKNVQVGYRDSQTHAHGFFHNTLIRNIGTALVLDSSSAAEIDSNRIIGNTGAILLKDSSRASITHNAINGNKKGVLLGTKMSGTLISGNAIFVNQGPGIDLGNNGITRNDTGDADEGANHLQNFPVLTAISRDGGNTIIRGTLNSTANTPFILEFFSNTECDPTGFGEGQTFLGRYAVATNAAGNATFSATLPGVVIPYGKVVTATATDTANNTSEFSACLPNDSAQQANLVFNAASNGTRLSTVTAPSAKGATAMSAEEIAAIRLLGNFPNPFSDATNIMFELPGQYKVGVTVLDQQGRTVALLQNAVLPAGRYTINWQAPHLPAGMYILRLDVNNIHKTFKMIHTSK